MREEQLLELLQEMTFEEKTDQLLQLTGEFYSQVTTATGPMQELGITEENVKRAGSVIGAVGAAQIKEIQRNYMEEHPHRIPLLFMLDVINGFRTVFPIPLALGAAFDPPLAGRCAAAAAKEAAVSGIHVTFAPMTDLVRDARWGRVMESTGEDPYLNSLYAQAMVKGFQGEDLKEFGSVASCVKHFAGYGAPVAGRDYNTVELSDHTLREFYLPADKAGIDAGAALVMTSFNTINGIPATGSRYLMRTILRGEMGFEGVLISDWAAIGEMIPHGYCEDTRDACRRALKAGVDIDMMTGIYSRHLRELTEKGEMDEALSDEAVLRILRLKNRLGLFEDPFKDADEEKEKEVLLCREHLDLAREAAVKTMVLLKNEHALPLDRNRKTALIGPYCDRRNLLGAWSFSGDLSAVSTLKEAVTDRDYFRDITLAAGCPMLGNDQKLEGFGEAVQEIMSEEERRLLLQEAVRQASEAEVVVLAVGEDRLQTGEAASNASIRIPQIQQELFDAIWEVNKHIVVVLFAGRPLDIRTISEKAEAVLLAWMPGTKGAEAITDLLTGDASPSGKLPMSFPYCVGQVPVFYNEYSTGRPHDPEKDKDRFRSKYLDIPNRPLYPFGYGLTYSEFQIWDLKLSAHEMDPDTEILASVRLKNTGERTAEETLQLYLRDRSASVVRPVRELKGVQKVTLKPGEEQEAVFAIKEEMLRFLSERDLWESEAGWFDIYIGTSSEAELHGEFLLKKSAHRTEEGENDYEESTDHARR